MITVNGDWFALETANTGYYLGGKKRISDMAATWCTGLRAHRFRWSICVWSCRRCKREIIVPRAFRS